MDEWIAEHRIIADLVALKEVSWFNPGTKQFAETIFNIPFGGAEVQDAADRLERFSPYIAKVFPETAAANGHIESPVQEITAMKGVLEELFGQFLPGRLLAKCDSHLPISGSIKARGGIYEVLKHAEFLAVEAGLLALDDNYVVLDSDEFRSFFGKYSIAVGSTGNLGLSIGIMGAQLGFKVSVHMSADARQWKKDMLRSKGVNVLEYESDYSLAVAEGRKEAASDSSCYFVDDENSINLFMGYAVAAERLKEQFAELGIVVDADHPLFAYLPCGVGGGPGGVAFGLKLAFQDNVHCIFAEPTHSPAMLLGLYTGLHDGVSVQDFGIDNLTAADGLAVGRPSGFVGRTMHELLDGVYTVSDENLYRYLAMMADSEDLALEPSAVAGVPGIVRVLGDKEYLALHGLAGEMDRATHLVWCTGGSMVPEEEMRGYYERGRGMC
ncbi:D-serine ammonia-lyase [Desulfovibrio sp. JC010]|nr:D-serine ammonia-lyase [Desulfovibrio sp. JC010]NDV28621.1 D-serine ammonia-lyase [Desulfovibrio sp. JC010]